MVTMNPRYLAYCRAHGKTPDEMRTFDTERFPGGSMCGFILWMGRSLGRMESAASRVGSTLRRRVDS